MDKIEFKKLEKELQKITQDFIEILPDVKYDIINIKYKNDSATLGKQFLSRNVKKDKIFKTLKDVNAWWKNIQKDENIYISFAEENIDLIWLDDVDIAEIDDTLTLIETSQNNYQAFIKIDKSIHKDELQKVKKILCERYNADRNALSYTQPMRLPGFLNQKPKYKNENGQGFIVNIKQKSNAVLNTEELITEVETEEVYYIETDRSEVKEISFSKKGKISKEIREEINNIEFKDYDFLERKIPNANIDEFKKEDSHGRESQSVQDFYFVKYLVESYFTNKEIRDILIEQSPNILNRKHDPIDYIKRTIYAVRSGKYYESSCISEEKAIEKRLSQNQNKIKLEKRPSEETEKKTKKLSI